MTLEEIYILAKQQNCPKCLTDEVRVMAHEIVTIYLPQNSVEKKKKTCYK